MEVGGHIKLHFSITGKLVVLMGALGSVASKI